MDRHGSQLQNILEIRGVVTRTSAQQCYYQLGRYLSTVVNKDLITCRCGSAKRAKYAVALRPTSRASCLHIFTTALITSRQHLSLRFRLHPRQSAYCPPDQPLPSIPPAPTSLPPLNAPPPKISTSKSLAPRRAQTQHAAHPPNSSPRLIFRSPECFHAPRTHLRASFHRTRILEPRSTVSHELLSRLDCTAVLPSLSRGRVKGSAGRMGFGT